MYLQLNKNTLQFLFNIIFNFVYNLGGNYLKKVYNIFLFLIFYRINFINFITILVKIKLYLMQIKCENYVN